LKKLLIKLGFLFLSYAILSYVNGIVKPMVIADSAVMQLQDSDVAYAQFKGVQRAFEFYWVLYLLPLLMFVGDIKKSFNSKEEDK
jgi:hypothetical protein